MALVRLGLMRLPVETASPTPVSFRYALSNPAKSGNHTGRSYPCGKNRNESVAGAAESGDGIRIYAQAGGCHDRNRSGLASLSDFRTSKPSRVIADIAVN